METKQEMMNKMLFEAVVKNKEKEVKALIELGADVNSKEIGGTTPLNLASNENYIEIAKLLIERGADVDAKDNSGWTPLHNATYNNHIETAKLLIEKGADVKAKNYDGETPLYWASRNNSVEIAKLLIDAGATKDVYGDMPTISPELKEYMRISLRNQIFSEMKEKMDLM